MIDCLQALLFPLLIPTGTSASNQGKAPATHALLGLLFVLFLPTLFFSDVMIRRFALNPGGPFYQYLTYAFLHQRVLHLLVNLYFLRLFARPLEIRIGSLRLAVLFVLAAVGGGLAHAFFYPPSAGGASLPLIGCSGAVFGVIGAYMIVFPFTTVRCIFCVVLVLYPFFRRTVHIYSILFLPVFWVLQWFVNWAFAVVARFFQIGVDSGAISSPAHLGGLAAGIGFAVLAHGLRAFIEDAVEVHAPAKDLEQKLAGALLGNRSTPRPTSVHQAIFSTRAPAPGVGESPPDETATAADPHPVEPAAAELVPADAGPLRPIHRLLLTGRKREARDVYAAMLTRQSDACIDPPGAQMDLARGLVELEDLELAVRAMENLIERHPDDDAGVAARLELAALLVRLERTPKRAVRLLKECLATMPPIDMEREARALLKKLPDSDPEDDGGQSPRNLFAPSPDNLDAEGAFAPKPPPERASLTDLDALFGAPDDTSNMHSPKPADAPEASDRSTPMDADVRDLLATIEGMWSGESSAEPSARDESSGYEVKLDDSGWIRKQGIEAPKPETENISPSMLNPGKHAPTLSGSRPAERIQDDLDADEPSGQQINEWVEKKPHREPTGRRGGVQPRDVGGPIQFPGMDRSVETPEDTELPTASPADPIKPAPRLPERKERQDARAAARPAARRQSPSPSPKRPEPPDHTVVSSIDEEMARADAPSGRESTPRVLVDGPYQVVQQPADRDAAPTAPEETTSAAFQTGLTSFPSNTKRAHSLSGDETVELTADRKYTLLLAPGTQADLDYLTLSLSPVYGLSVDGMKHALLRRRGILAGDLAADQARKLATDLAAHGQTAQLVPQDRRLDFGPTLDVMQLHDRGWTVRVSHEQGSEDHDWMRVILLGCGWVGPEPNAACRLVIDMFVRDPNRHFRIWENTCVLPPEAPLGDRRRRFFWLMARLIRKAEGAVLTRTLHTLAKNKHDETTAQFGSLIEYDNYLRWHVLAHCVPSRRFALSV
jgi:membrane associated rhomboid family serine protease